MRKKPLDVKAQVLVAGGEEIVLCTTPALENEERQVSPHCVRVYIYICICLYIYIFVYLRISMYICECIAALDWVKYE